MPSKTIRLFCHIVLLATGICPASAAGRFPAPTGYPDHGLSERVRGSTAGGTREFTIRPFFEGFNVFRFEMTGSRPHWFSPLSDHILMTRQATRMPWNRRVPALSTPEEVAAAHVKEIEDRGAIWSIDHGYYAGHADEGLTVSDSKSGRLTRLPVQCGRSPVPAGFAGRWNLTVFDRDHPRAWWLEVRDGGEGAFVGAPNGELRFLLRDGWSRSGEPADGLFRARLVNGRLEGVFSVAGESDLRWVGRRAPAAFEKDDGSRRETGPRRLFNGRDFSGWETRSSPVVFRPLAAPPPGSEASGWRIQEGLLSTSGRGVPLVTREQFRDFALHVEFRVAPGGNSGIGLRGRYEVQIIDDYGRPVTGHTTGGVYGRLRPSANAARPAGEWQGCDIRLVGRQVTVTLNGVRVIDKGEIDGPTAIAIDSDENQPGPICLQGDHGAVDFRNIVLTPLIPGF